MEKNPTVVLTGARGRIGRAILAALGGRWDLHAVSRVAGQSFLSLDEMLEGAGSLRADALIHCAWSTVPASAEEAGSRASEIDLPLLRRLIERLRRDPSPPLMLFMSTGAVYGPAQGRPSREDDAPQPIGEYARGKLEAEAVLRDSGLPVCILRVANVYAIPSRPEDRQGVIGHLVGAALAGRPFHQWGADSVKDYIHSSDFFSALEAVMERNLRGTWNLGSGVPVHLSELIAIVEKTTGRALEIDLLPAAPWDVSDNRLDISRLRAATGWKPVISIENGVADVVAAMRALATDAGVSRALIA